MECLLGTALLCMGGGSTRELPAPLPPPKAGEGAMAGVGGNKASPAVPWASTPAEPLLAPSPLFPASACDLGWVDAALAGPAEGADEAASAAASISVLIFESVPSRRPVSRFLLARAFNSLPKAALWTGATGAAGGAAGAGGGAGAAGSRAAGGGGSGSSATAAAGRGAAGRKRCGSCGPCANSAADASWPPAQGRLSSSAAVSRPLSEPGLEASALVSGGRLGAAGASQSPGSNSSDSPMLSARSSM
mmetsp:Transcript_98897/g.318940  ORF Transcript_98897/g.318940 Transcript_98897/m.318940 type:complete len:248 (+) Transcript_98897:1112-1855(+)